jgi:hypothetical protein
MRGYDCGGEVLRSGWQIAGGGKVSRPTRVDVDDETVKDQATTVALIVG